uniref:Uncharacterized protein n=1 Tax=Rhizophora mucronata TaxID=61149 RepID=A0A2P2PF97_RHIMU
MSGLFSMIGFLVQTGWDNLSFIELLFLLVVLDQEDVFVFYLVPSNKRYDSLNGEVK